MIVATAARLEPLTVTRCFESASAAFAIPRLGAGNAFAVSIESGWKAFCSIMRTSTSWIAADSCTGRGADFRWTGYRLRVSIPESAPQQLEGAGRSRYGASPMLRPAL